MRGGTCILRNRSTHVTNKKKTLPVSFLLILPYFGHKFHTAKVNLTIKREIIRGVVNNFCMPKLREARIGRRPQG